MLKDLEKKRYTCKGKVISMDKNNTNGTKLTEDSCVPNTGFIGHSKVENYGIKSVNSVKHPLSKNIDVASFIRSLNLDPDLKSPKFSKAQSCSKSQSDVQRQYTNNTQQKVKHCKSEENLFHKNVSSDRIFVPSAYHKGHQYYLENKNTAIANTITKTNNGNESTVNDFLMPCSTHRCRCSAVEPMPNHKCIDKENKLRNSKSDSDLHGCAVGKPYKEDTSFFGDFCNGFSDDLTGFNCDMSETLRPSLPNDEVISITDNQQPLCDDRLDKTDAMFKECLLHTGCATEPCTSPKSSEFDEDTLRDLAHCGNNVDGMLDESVDGDGFVNEDVFRKTSVQCRLYNISRRRRTGVREKHELVVQNTPILTDTDPVNAEDCCYNVSKAHIRSGNSHKESTKNGVDRSPQTPGNDQNTFSTFRVPVRGEFNGRFENPIEPAKKAESNFKDCTIFSNNKSFHSIDTCSEKMDQYKKNDDSTDGLSHSHFARETEERERDNKTVLVNSRVRPNNLLSCSTQPSEAEADNMYSRSSISQHTKIRDRRSMSLECSSACSSDRTALTVCKQNSVPIIRVSSFDSEEPVPERQFDLSKLLMHQSITHSKSYGIRKNRRRKSKQQSFLRVTGENIEFHEQRPMSDAEKRVMTEPEQTVTDGCGWDVDVSAVGSSKTEKDAGTRKSSKWKKALGAFRKTSLQQRAWENSRHSRRKLRERRVEKTKSVD